MVSTNIEKYGCENPMQRTKIKAGMAQRSIEKTGYATPLHNPAIHQKGRDRLLSEEGIVNVGQRDSVKLKIKSSLKKHYGLDVTCAAQVPELLQKQFETTHQRYGTHTVLTKHEIRELGFQEQERKYGARHFLQAVAFNEKRHEYLLKQYRTNLQRYGGITPMSDPAIVNKQHETKRRNGTFKVSSKEDIVFGLLSKKWKVIRQYKDPRYPFCCDFYLPEFDTFIEYHGMFTHGSEAFDAGNPNHEAVIRKWQAKGGQFYKNAIRNWTVADPKKRQTALENKLNFIELWGMGDVELFLTDDLQLRRRMEDQIEELTNINKRSPDYSDGANWNRTVLSYQSHFYKAEAALWRDDPSIRARLLTNRVKHLGKAARVINDVELLRGFTISGIRKGFSHHSPMWIKKFIEEYRPEAIYDPFGGWGQRLLGAGDTRYIYNDVDARSCAGIQTMIDDLNLKNKIVHNRDAYSTTPIENYDAVFTCPPYYNIEVYQNRKIPQSYEDWVNHLWRSAVECAVKPGMKWFAFIMSEKYSEDLKRVCLEEGLVLDKELTVGLEKTSYLTGRTLNREILLIFTARR
jgi:16S rRNA G966 N2-methylase RsmD